MGKQFDYANQAWYEDTTGTYISGHYVGLTAKGAAKKDTSGFVQEVA